jgi:parallel beta-helix repeat protein
MRRWLAGGALLALALLVGAGVALEQIGIAPRALSPYIAKRTSGHNPFITGAGDYVSKALMDLDRGAPPVVPASLLLTAGAQPQPAGRVMPGILASTPDEVRAAVARAQPGDVIVLAPGTYRFAGRAVDANRAGEPAAPIIVRAERPGSVHVEFDQDEGFRVSAPYWRFEDLEIRGVCSEDAYCEHAFHVVGAASHFSAVNNTIIDFNAHFKINGQDGHFPDDGLIASNTLTNTRARDTSNPVTPIDLVAANGWTIRANLIEDFAKTEGNGVSFGGFAKGAGSANVFERNVVWCEHKLHGQGGQRVGLSLGGGGTGAPYCRDSKCISEQHGSTIRGNLIASCSDVGIYLNSASDSRVEDNTIIDTVGIDVRFPTSSAQLDGNLVDGAIRSRNGGLMHLGENRTTLLWMAYLGVHPVRALFAAPLDGDFAWRGDAPARAAARKGPGLCGGAAIHALGAFDDFSGCLRPVVRR